MKKYFMLFLLVTCYRISFAQGESSIVTTAMPTLSFQQSPVFIGAGQIGAAVPMMDPLGFYFNPAQLGYFSKENNLAVLGMPQKTKWFGPYDDFSFNSFGIDIGYNFKKYRNLPLSIGIGYIHNKFSYGDFTITGPNSPAPLGKEESKDVFDCFSLGVGYDYYLQFNLGFSIKSYKSNFPPSISEDGKLFYPKASGTALDFGAMITTPVSQLLFNNVKYNLSTESYLKPKFDLTLGYSITNIGKKIWYLDPAQADPIPRTARLGYTLDFGIELFGKEMEINTIDYSFTAEAEDILVQYSNGGTQYQGIFGGINPIKHLIKLDRDPDVVVHRGNILRLFETLYITSGKYYGNGYNNIRSNGYGFSSEGIFKLLSSSIDNAAIKYIANHFAIEYYDVNNFLGLNDVGYWAQTDTNFQGFAFYIKGIEL